MRHGVKGMPGPRIDIVSGERANEVTQFVRVGLGRFNESKAGERKLRPLILSLVDEQGHVVGGVVGESFWNAIHIEMLWVADEQRGRGYGKRLLEAAEIEARARGGEVVYLNTFSFQAPMFYERLGYKKFGELADVPKGEKRIWYAKRLRTVA